MFVEILPVDDTRNEIPRFVDAYIAEVEPERCGSLMKQLACDLPLRSSSSTSEADDSFHIDLSHLKRVRRTFVHTTVSHSHLRDSSDPLPSKRHRTNDDDTVRLEILLGAASALDNIFQDPVNSLQTKYRLHSVYKSMVPGRPADAEQEAKEFLAVWPIVFFANRTAESRERERQLSTDEIASMRRGIQVALKDADEQVSDDAKTPRVGTVVVNPETDTVVARSIDERKLQPLASTNPLATSVLFAIQGVSRQERQAAMNHGIESRTFQSGQYLCTGCDVYTTLEPTIYEAMALVHARIRRVVVGCPRSDALGGLTDLSVHALPGTNHKYRAFVCEFDSDLATACITLRDEK